jgi:4-amino-4-deoxy-L-arabinose transferase-like glycosyltransferase
MRHITEKPAIAAVTFAFLVAIAAYYYALLPVGTLKHIDEYWTLDRVGSFVETGDWLTVRSENKVNFNKPPLQYWVSAVFLKSGSDLEYALRLPSFIFGIGVLLATGALAFQFCPRPIVFPVSILILGSSFRYWENALSALLDMGSAFFITVALTGFFAAIKQPRWWYLVALSAGVGALQKAPVALAVIVVASVVVAIWRARYKTPSLQQIYLNRHFALSVCLLALLLAVWPLLQIWQHGFAFLHAAYVKQMWDRFAGAEGLVGESQIALGLFRNQPLLEVPLMVSVLLLPAVFRRAESYVLTTLFLLYILLALIAGRNGSARYSLMIYPAMAASLSAIIANYLDWKALPVAIVYSLILGTPWKSAEKIKLTGNGQGGYVQFLANIKRAMRDDETFIRCRWQRPKGGYLYPGEISYYAAKGKPVFVLSDPKRLSAITPPYRGICTTDEFTDLVKWLDQPEQIEVAGRYVHWTAKRAAQQADSPENAPKRRSSH